MTELKETGSTGTHTKVTHMESFVAGTNFLVYEMKLKAFFQVNNFPEEKKVNLLITLLPIQVLEKLICLCLPEEIENKNINECLDLLREYYIPKRNVIIERFKFNQAKQEAKQTIKEFVAKLKSLSMFCEYGVLLDEYLRDQFIFGLKDNIVQKKLLIEGSKVEKLTFILALNMANKLSESDVNETRYIWDTKKNKRSVEKITEPKSGATKLTWSIP